jgi:NADPH-dependent ferric siderophore reductase
MFEFLKPKRRRADAEVVAVRTISPHVQCITLGGQEVAAFLKTDGMDAPGAWLKVSFPNGHVRAYTIRRIDRQAGTLDMEFVLHEHGPASAWASQARIGERLGISGPRDARFALPPDASWLILAGDATALPAIQSICQVLPAGVKAEIYIEVPSPADQQVIESPAQLEISWLHEQAAPGAALCQALLSKPRPNGDGYIWAAGESGAVRTLRTHFLQSYAMPPWRISAIGYWKVGHAAHRGG